MLRVCMCLKPERSKHITADWHAGVTTALKTTVIFQFFSLLEKSTTFDSSHVNFISNHYNT